MLVDEDGTVICSNTSHVEGNDGQGLASSWVVAEVNGRREARRGGRGEGRGRVGRGRVEGVDRREGGSDGGVGTVGKRSAGSRWGIEEEGDDESVEVFEFKVLCVIVQRETLTPNPSSSALGALSVEPRALSPKPLSKQEKPNGFLCIVSVGSLELKQCVLIAISVMSANCNLIDVR